MKTVMVWTPKGGSSKSTLVCEIAVCLTMRGHSVAIKDLDPQATTTTWYQRREQDTPTVVAPSVKMSRIDADFLIIDTPPGVSSADFIKKEKVDLVLVPVRPSPHDLTSALSIVRDLKRYDFVFVLTQTPPRARIVGEATRMLAAQGRVLPVNLGFRVDFATAAISGEAAVEYEKTKASLEVQEITTSVLSYLDA
ncbi:MAG: ParA family protein [Betaproteobacteria bacterium]|jgi:chromosome partitioning protein